MAESENGKADAAAEKAYAEAAQSIAPVKVETADKPEPVKDEPVTTAMAIPSVKPKAVRKPAAKASKPKPAAKAKPVAKPVAKVAAKPVKKVAKPAAKPAPKTKVAATKPAAAKGAATPKSTIPTLATTSIAKAKDTTMTMKTKITEGLESIMSDAQAKAKEAFEKSSAMFGDYAEFTKGNVEAVVESGKVLTEGLQDMSTNFVAESRSVFESVSADVKEMAAAKSPTDLIQLQSEMFRKSFDSAVAYGSKNTEAMIKIASDAMAPISGRVSLAVEKVRSVAA